MFDLFSTLFADAIYVKNDNFNSYNNLDDLVWVFTSGSASSKVISLRFHVPIKKQTLLSLSLVCWYHIVFQSKTKFILKIKIDMSQKYLLNLLVVWDRL